jgi:hypothetical protein
LPLVLIGIVGSFFGGIGAIIVVSIQKKRLIKQTGTSDYKTAVKVKSGAFPNFEIYHKAVEMQIDNYEEYLFMLEMEKLKIKDEKN